MKPFAATILAALALSLSSARAEAAGGFPDLSTIPAGLGVNIHFTDPQPGEMKMLAGAGFRFVRMDFAWNSTEKQQGVYDFSEYDRLLAALDPHHIRALLILDYSNPLYDSGLSPHTDAGRAAFARWAAAAVQHFRGRGVLWEMYNEPNGFWKPQFNAQDYIALALATGKAIKSVAPDELYVGPASSGIPLDFLEECFKAGLLQYFDAVSVHPYRQSGPESAAADYTALRSLIERYKPAGKSVPILSGEWGYSSGWNGFDDARQGRMLPRELLTNLASGVPLSIWYDWHDDGINPADPEHHFGTVHHAYHPARDPVYDPKPAYTAMKRLSTELAGYHFNKRLPLADDADWLLLFSKGNDVKPVAWTTAHDPHEVETPLGKLKLNETVDYAALAGPSANLARLAAACSTIPPEIRLPGSQGATLSITVRNPLDHPLHVTLAATSQAADLAPAAEKTFTVAVPPTRSARPIPLPVTLDFGPLGSFTQYAHVLSANPLTPTVLPRMGDELLVRVENPSGEPFEGKLVIQSGAFKATRPFRLAAHQTETIVNTPMLHAPPGQPFEARVSITDLTGHLLSGGNDARYAPLPLSASALKLTPDGDPKVASDQSLHDVRLVASYTGPSPAVRLTYRFDPGWKFVCLNPTTPDLQTIPGKPEALGLWVQGDGTGNFARLRFVDSTHQTFQSDGPALNFTGWKYITIPLDRSHGTSWGGPADGRIHYPIRFSALFLLDAAQRNGTHGQILLSCPTLLYGPDKSDWTSAPDSTR